MSHDSEQKGESGQSIGAMLNEEPKLLWSLKIKGEFPHEIRCMLYSYVDVPINIIYTLDGKYIGDEEHAERLFKKGIVPEAYGTNNVCSIGFNAKEQKWYGWSHRAMNSFGIGDKVKKNDSLLCGFSGDPSVALYSGFVAKTLDDAKRMAIAFAESVA